MDRVSRILRIASYFILISLIFFANPPNIIAGDLIRINGSGTCLEMIKPFVEVYGRNNRNISFEMGKSLGSSGAIKALLAGVIDIAVVARPLKPEEIVQGGRSRAFGKTPLAIVTAKSVPLKNISTRELEDIYSGKTLNWPNGETIRIIMRPNEDADTKILKSLSPGMVNAISRAQHRRGVIMVVTDPESYETVSRTSGSIGSAGLCHILVGKRPLNVLSLNGVMPSRKNLANKTYPLAKDIHFATTDKLSDTALKFLQFVYSKEGRSMAERNGVLITLDNP